MTHTGYKGDQVEKDLKSMENEYANFCAVLGEKYCVLKALQEEIDSLQKHITGITRDIMKVKQEKPNEEQKS